MRPVSFSYQRKAGMSWLLPSSSPAWLAPVCEERSHSQGTIRWLPSSSQRAIVGAWPSLERPAQDGLGEPVDLEQDHARDVGAVRLAHAPRPAAHDPQLAGVVVEAQRRAPAASG